MNNTDQNYYVLLTESELFALRVAVEHYKNVPESHSMYNSGIMSEQNQHSKSIDSVEYKLDREWML